MIDDKRKLKCAVSIRMICYARIIIKNRVCNLHCMQSWKIIVDVEHSKLLLDIKCHRSISATSKHSHYVNTHICKCTTIRFHCVVAYLDGTWFAKMRFVGINVSFSLMLLYTQ